MDALKTADQRSNCNSYENCPVAATLSVIGGKWKPIILYLISEGDNRFGRLLRGINGISRKVLTEQLRELERDDIVRRIDFEELPFRVEYVLTSKGETLKPLLDLLYIWGQEHVLLHTQNVR